MIKSIRLLIFYCFAVIGIGFLLLGSLFLDKKQLNWVKDILHSLENKLEPPTLTYHQPEPRTIEDEIYDACATVRQDMYRQGTNEDLSIECTICGRNTKRGDYYARQDALDSDIPLPKMFICPDCYDKLPYREAK